LTLIILHFIFMPDIADVFLGTIFFIVPLYKMNRIINCNLFIYS